MLLLPREVILCVSQFVTIDCINNELFLERSKKYNYSMRNLYATCKAFKWMLQMECVCLECGEYRWNITTTDINGKLQGMYYDFCTKGINGYIYYVGGKMKHENVKSIYPFGNEYRYKDGWQFKERCNRWRDKSCRDDCDNCDYFCKVDKIIYKKDPLIKELHSYNKDGALIAENLARFMFDLEFIKKDSRGIDGYSILREKRSEEFIKSLGLFLQ